VAIVVNKEVKMLVKCLKVLVVVVFVVVVVVDVVVVVHVEDVIEVLVVADVAELDPEIFDEEIVIKVFEEFIGLFVEVVVVFSLVGCFKASVFVCIVGLALVTMYLLAYTPVELPQKLQFVSHAELHFTSK
jgi:hypothetical protein